MSPPLRVPTAVGVDVSNLAGTDAHAVLARLRSSHPVAWVQALDGWLVTGYAPALAVMRDPTTYTVEDPRFSTAAVVGPSMLSLEGSEHHRHRTPFAADFRPARLEARFAHEIEDVACGLVETIRPLGYADLRTSVAGPLSVLIIASALGLHDVQTSDVLDWYGAIVRAVTVITEGGDVAPDTAAAINEVSSAVLRSVRDARNSLLARAAGVSEAEVVSNALVMMFGGIETTEGMIANALVHLLGDENAVRAVRADRSLLGVAVEESLRLEPAAAVVDRYATEDTEIAGAAIRRGDLVRVSLAAANRDPSVFADPDRYDLRRDNIAAQLAFARGPHVCIAMDLARMETRTALTALLDGLPHLRLDAVEPATGLVFRKPQSVLARWRV